ncbi:type II restriction endonuclease [Propioniciclava sinopodophylli]|uniref:type II restriction endonuclease n=1 Tax=Propioniciclava sinopodophylli TaxID=1837344 RepID=UPI002490BA62|nr:type II restriction endonuclease [Propioniciclava sinopodophylli]
MASETLSTEDVELGDARAAIEDSTGASTVYCKFLSANDTGETGGNQVGILIGKASGPGLLGIHGRPGDAPIKEPLAIAWQGGPPTGATANYYGSKDEYRITGTGAGLPTQSDRSTGDLFVAVRPSQERALKGWVLSGDAAIAEYLGAFGLSPANTNRLFDFSGARPLAEPLPSVSLEDSLILQFVEGLLEGQFPTTREISNAARKIDGRLYPGAPSRRPDAAIRRWAALEYKIFLAVEERVFGGRIDDGFATVEEFVGVANTVLNRRKSRAGHSLENHLAALFADAALAFDAQPRTEGSRRPDFIFPSAAAYHDPAWDPARLVFLAAKTTCKDRWRQILNEAARIPQKHLFTLQQGISSAQLDEMEEADVTLVVPAANRDKFPSSHQDRILSLAEFIAHVRSIVGNDRDGRP